MKQNVRRQKVKRKQHPLAGFVRQHARVLLGLLVLVILVHDLFGERGFLAMRRAQKEAVKLQEEIQQLHAENARLAGEVEALKTDPRMIERIAREELNLARPGERIFKLPPKPPQEQK